MITCFGAILASAISTAALADSPAFQCDSPVEHAYGYWVNYQPVSNRLTISGYRFQSDFSAALRYDFTVAQVQPGDGCTATSEGLTCDLSDVVVAGRDNTGVSVGNVLVDRLVLDVHNDVLSLEIESANGRVALPEIRCEKRAD
jgi:hypothetical protein